MKLDRDEKGLEASFHKGQWKSVKNLAKAKSALKSAAEETLKKSRRINIRLSAKDLEGIQIRAAREGMPYQTLISSIIHKYVTRDAA